MQIFEFRSLHSLLDDNLLKLFCFLDLLFKFGALSSIYSLLTLRTVEVGKYDSGSVVTFLNLLHDTLQVESVTTTQNYTRLLTNFCKRNRLAGCDLPARRISPSQQLPSHRENHHLDDDQARHRCVYVVRALMLVPALQGDIRQKVRGRITGTRYPLDAVLTCY